MNLNELEQQVVDCIAAKADALLEDLILHVGIPTGGFNEEGIEQTRELLVTRLEALGATTTTIAPDSKPEWLLGGQPGGYQPATSVCERLNNADGSDGSKRVLIAGHMDTVHDPKGPFNKLTISIGRCRALDRPYIPR